MGTRGLYTVRDGTSTEHASNGRISSSYVKLVTFGVGFGLLCVAFYGLSSLATSFNDLLGSLSLACVYVGFLTSVFVTSSLMNILGAKTCAVSSGFCALVYSASYFYPSWYTLIPSSLVMGVGYGLLYAASGTIKNDEVQKCAEHWKVDPLTYQGRFSAIMSSFGMGVSSFLAGGISISILSSFNSNSTLPVQDSCAVNDSNMAQSTVSVDPKTYYTLVGTMTGVSLLSIATLSIMRGAAYHQCRVCSIGLKEALRTTVTYSVKVFKQVSTPAYMLVLPLRMNQGFMIAYVAGVFTKVSFLWLTMLIGGGASCICVTTIYQGVA